MPVFASGRGALHPPLFPHLNHQAHDLQVKRFIISVQGAQGSIDDFC